MMSRWAGLRGAGWMGAVRSKAINQPGTRGCHSRASFGRYRYLTKYVCISDLNLLDDIVPLLHCLQSLGLGQRYFWTAHERVQSALYSPSWRTKRRGSTFMAPVRLCRGCRFFGCCFFLFFCFVFLRASSERATTGLLPSVDKATQARNLY